VTWKKTSERIQRQREWKVKKTGEGRMTLMDTLIPFKAVNHGLSELYDKFDEVMGPIRALKNILVECNRNDLAVPPVEVGVVLEALYEQAVERFEAEYEKQHEAIGFQYGPEERPPWVDTLDKARRQAWEHFEASRAAGGVS